MTSARDVIADYLSEHVFSGEDCESCDENNVCTKTCSQYKIDCVGHMDGIIAALNAAGYKVVGREPTEKMCDAVWGRDAGTLAERAWRAMFDAAEDGHE